MRKWERRTFALWKSRNWNPIIDKHCKKLYHRYNKGIWHREMCDCSKKYHKIAMKLKCRLAKPSGAIRMKSTSIYLTKLRQRFTGSPWLTTIHLAKLQFSWKKELTTSPHTCSHCSHITCNQHGFKMVAVSRSHMKSFAIFPASFRQEKSMGKPYLFNDCMLHLTHTIIHFSSMSKMVVKLGITHFADTLLSHRSSSPNCHNSRNICVSSQINCWKRNTCIG